MLFSSSEINKNQKTEITTLTQKINDIGRVRCGRRSSMTQFNAAKDNLKQVGLIDSSSKNPGQWIRQQPKGRI